MKIGDKVEYEGEKYTIIGACISIRWCESESGDIAVVNVDSLTPIQEQETPKNRP